MYNIFILHFQSSIQSCVCCYNSINLKTNPTRKHNPLTIFKPTSCMSASNTVCISGATGPHKNLINGVYLRTELCHDGLPEYRKRSNGCIRIQNRDGRWKLMLMGTQQAAELASVEGKCQLESCNGVWRINNESGVCDNPDVKLDFAEPEVISCTCILVSTDIFRRH